MLKAIHAYETIDKCASAQMSFQNKTSSQIQTKFLELVKKKKGGGASLTRNHSVLLITPHIKCCVTSSRLFVLILLLGMGLTCVHMRIVCL